MTRQTPRQLPHQSMILSAPILPTLLRLSAPNALAMMATIGATVIETIYVGYIGIPALAAMAMVFPIAMIQHSFSIGAMGGGISAAISRALGRGRADTAHALTLHALIIGTVLGIVASAGMLILGPTLYHTLGARGDTLAEAIRYSDTLFTGAVLIWVGNTLLSMVRGTGNMRMPSVIIMVMACLQVVLGYSLGVGFGPIPGQGMVGVALGQVIAYGAGSLFLIWYLTQGPSPLKLAIRNVAINIAMFGAILRVGAVSCIGPLQTNLTILIGTAVMAHFGVEALAGYGIVTRLEMLLVNIAFGVGVASVPMVGTAIGSGAMVRARHVTWTAAALGAAMLGVIGIAVALSPGIWVDVFTTNAGVQAFAYPYLTIVGPSYVFFGLGLCLFFASQGAGQVHGTVLAGTLRMGVVAIGGWYISVSGAPYHALFTLVAAGMLLYGLAAGLAVKHIHWHPD